MDKIKVGIAGCLGRMGQELVKATTKDKRIKFVGGYDLKNSKTHSNDIFKKANVIIDFSSPAAIKGNVSLALSYKTGLVVGTTGLNHKETILLKKASKKIPILYSSNMSLGVNLLFELVRQTSLALKDIDYDIEISETHHKHKKDAPSGTAISLGEIAAEGRKIPFSKNKVLNRTNKRNKRKIGNIGFAVTRGGEIAGEHTVSFIGDNDRIDLLHKASNRSIFVKGAVEAAVFLFKQKPGLYSMKDVLNIKPKSKKFTQ